MKTKHTFKYWQWRVIICSMIGYALFYFVLQIIKIKIYQNHEKI